MAEPPTPEEVALEEMSMLQEVIARHEKHAFAVKAFLAAVLTGLATLVFSLKIPVDLSMVTWLGLAAVAGFGTWATAHKIVCGKAIRRSAEVERFLRSPGTVIYDGPKIGESLAKSNTLEQSWTSARHLTNSVPLILAVAAVLCLKIVAPKVSEAAASAKKVTLQSITFTNDKLEASGVFGDRDCMLSAERVNDSASSPLVVKQIKCTQNQ
jgi:hypothetical protein